MKKVKAWVKDHAGLVVFGGITVLGFGMALAIRAIAGELPDPEIVYDHISSCETPAIFEGRNLTVEEVVTILGMDEYLLQQLENENLVPADLAANFILDYIDDVAPQTKDILEPIVFYGK